MPGDRLALRAVGVAALLVAALVLGVFLGAPNMAVAQQDTTTTVVEDDSTDTTVVEDDSTDTTVVEDDSTDTTVDESTDVSEDSGRHARGDHDCADDSDDGSSQDSSEGLSSSDA